MVNFNHYSLFNNGGLAVTFFFVLSGFLITYLLLKERDETKKISVKNFYMRRILRIWPLYFLLVVIGTLVVPFALQHIHFSYEMPYRFEDVILYYLFFMPFMVNIIYGHSLLEPLWSIGVEELFYIIWAPLFKWLKKHVLKLIFAVIILKILLLVILKNIDAHDYVVKVAGTLKFEAMAIGGLASYIIFNRKKEISGTWLFSVPMQIVLFGFILLRFFTGQYLIENSIVFEWLFSSFIFSDLVCMLIFAWLIVNVSLNPAAIVKMNSKVLNFLGEISYGIYMYHMLVIFGAVLLFKDTFNGLNPVVASILFYALVTGAVVLTSFLSKKIFENQFLKFKSGFK